MELSSDKIEEICKEVDEKLKELDRNNSISNIDKFIIYRRLFLSYFQKLPFNRKDIKKELKKIETRIKK